MKWMADPHFKMVEDEFTPGDATIESYRLNLPERKDCGEEKKFFTILEQETLEENLTATYWG